MPRASTAPRKIAALTLAAATATLGLTLVQAAPSAAAAETQTCPAPGEFPELGNGQNATDSNINVFVGGNYLGTGGAAESEGVLVVAGNATFDNGKTFNVGTAGVGSGIIPEAKSDMLIVGGDILVKPGTTLDVGAAIPGFDGGGNIIAGGSITGDVATNGGTQTANKENALGDFADFPAAITAESEALAAATGVERDPSAPGATFIGDGTDELQVFTISAEELSAESEVYFANVGESAPIVINVTGQNLALDLNYLGVNGVRSDFGAELGNTSARILWNLPDATTVLLDGSSQIPGSFLIPTAGSTVDVTAHTNGRMYVAGDLTMRGGGNEQHAYPWIGDALTDCTPREENVETPDEGEENETPDEGDEPEVPGEEQPEPPVDEEDETPVTEDETPQVEEEVVVEETEAPVADDATNAADEESLPVTGANIGLMLPLAALLMVLIGGGLALIARTRSRA